MSALEKQKYVERKNTLEQTEIKRNYKFEIIPEVSKGIKHVHVGVTRTWKYATIEHIESGSYDEYDVWYTKELDGWKIVKIEGMLDIFQSNRLASTGLSYSDVNDLKAFIASVDAVVQNYFCEFEALNAETVDASQAVSLSSSSSEIQPRAITYNRNNAVNYATTYALSPNPAYPIFH